MKTLLRDSQFCRLCCEESPNGVKLFDDKTKICDLVNKYLPVSIVDDGSLPTTICQGCHIHVRDIASFHSLIDEGQKKIKSLHEKEMEYLNSIKELPVKIEDGFILIKEEGSVNRQQANISSGIDVMEMQHNNESSIGESSIQEIPVNINIKEENHSEPEDVQDESMLLNDVSNLDENSQASTSQESKNKSLRDKSYCLYCDTTVVKFASHIKKKHANELQVKKIFRLKSSKDIKRGILMLRKKGEMILCRKIQTSKPDLTEDEISSFNNITAPREPAETSESLVKLLESMTSDVLVKDPEVEDKLYTQVFQHMKQDDMYFIAKNDELIWLFGAWCMKNKKLKHSTLVTARRIRELSKLLCVAQKMKPDIINLFDLLRPCYYNLIVDITKKISKFDPTRQEFHLPLFAIKIVTSVKECCAIGVQCALNNENLSLISPPSDSDIKELMTMLESDWKNEITNRASVNFYLEDISIMTLANDLKLLNDFLGEKIKLFSHRLKGGRKDVHAFNMLNEAIFCKVILFNKQRSIKLHNLLLKTYEGCSNVITDPVKETLSVIEKILMVRFRKIAFLNSRSEPILFSREIIVDIKLLLQIRNKYVDSSYPYLFTRINCTVPLDDNNVLMKYAKKCGAEQPLAIMESKLSKHIVHFMHLFNMNSADSFHLASFMESSIGIRWKSYSLPEELTDLAKISKLLGYMENGLSDNLDKYRGSFIDELVFDLEENLMDEDEDYLPILEEIEQEQQEPIPQGSSSDSDSSDYETWDPSKEEWEKPKRQRKLIPWTDRQKEITLDYFQDNIARRKPPIQSECEDLIAKYPDIMSNKDWLKIKVFIQNQYTKYSNDPPPLKKKKRKIHD